MVSTQRRSSIDIRSGRFVTAALMGVGLVAQAMAEPAQISVTNSQARNLDIQLVRPIASRTDQTLAFPACGGSWRRYRKTQ
jgi:hypothetical protein